MKRVLSSGLALGFFVQLQALQLYFSDCIIVVVEEEVAKIISKPVELIKQHWNGTKGRFAEARYVFMQAMLGFS